ncbi:MAG: glutathione peroxidase [Pseudomonadota bacterium]
MKQFAPFLLLGFAATCAPQTEAPAPASPTDSVLDQAANETPMTSPSPDLYAVDFTTITGQPMPFSEFEGQVTLVVNTASRCGYTGQYAGLQELHATFKDQGFNVLGVPSNDFGAQEPGTEAQIVEFCETNYGVEFPLTRKTVVVGEDQHEFYKLAKQSLGDKAQPKWNFHKVLVGRDGGFIQAYPSSIRPADTELVADIERALAGS